MVSKGQSWWSGEREGSIGLPGGGLSSSMIQGLASVDPAVCI